MLARAAIHTADASLKQPTEKTAPIPPPEASGLFFVRRRLARPGPAQAPAADIFLGLDRAGSRRPPKNARKTRGVSCGRKNKHISKMLKTRRLGPTVLQLGDLGLWIGPADPLLVRQL